MNAARSSIPDQRRPSRWRWLAVLPVAILASMIVHQMSGLLIRGLIGLGAYQPGETSLAAFVAMVLAHLPHELAFVAVGGALAPSHRRLTSIVLAVLAVTLSLLTHILVQQHVGATNWLHFSLEAAGAAGGVIGISWRVPVDSDRSESGTTADRDLQ